MYITHYFSISYCDKQRLSSGKVLQQTLQCRQNNQKGKHCKFSSEMKKFVVSRVIALHIIVWLKDFNYFTQCGNEFMYGTSWATAVPALVCSKPKPFIPYQELFNNPLDFLVLIFTLCLRKCVSISLFCSFYRLCAEDLNSSVLACMTDTLGYSLSEIIHTLTTNRPSTIMAYYHLLLNKLSSSQKGAKASKVHTSFAHMRTHTQTSTNWSTSKLMPVINNKSGSV